MKRTERDSPLDSVYKEYSWVRQIMPLTYSRVKAAPYSWRAIRLHFDLFLSHFLYCPTLVLQPGGYSDTYNNFMGILHWNVCIFQIWLCSKFIFKPSFTGQSHWWSVNWSLVDVSSTRSQRINTDINAICKATSIKILFSFSSILLKAMHWEHAETH